MIEEIDDQIDVVAVFSSGKVSPLLFSWRNRRYSNLKTSSMWMDSEGDAKRVHFSVITDSANLYELCFHTRSFQWTLVRIYHE